MMIRKHLTLKFTTLILIAFACQSCANSKNDWTIEYRGKQTKLFTLKNPNNLEVTITNYGGKVVSLIVPDKNGKFEDPRCRQLNIICDKKHINSYCL